MLRVDVTFDQEIYARLGALFAFLFGPLMVIDVLDGPDTYRRLQEIAQERGLERVHPNWPFPVERLDEFDKPQ